MALDHEAMGQHDLVSILEVMGRNAGWIAAEHPRPKVTRKTLILRLIYLPSEVPFTEKYLEDVRRVLSRNKHCLLLLAKAS